ncbi:MAG: hypothetical protein JST85_19895 [Acidobacteria bacterium]|nr:hypothetical protein [Acidobacteriota bacterium]
MRAVQMIKRTISILLAGQLLVSFGLYGGLCCVKAVEISAPQKVEQTAQAEEHLPPCHRKKAAEKPASHQHHQTQSTHQTQTRKLAASVINRDCCALKREAPEGEPLTTIVAQQTGKMVALLKSSPWRDDEIAMRASPIPVQVSSTHSPPHTGFQLSLRI